MKTTLAVGKKYRITEEFSTWAKEGHEVGGVSKALSLSVGNSFTVTAKRPHGWFEAQVTLTERYVPPFGGAVIRWRGQILVSRGQVKHFKEATK